MTITQTAPKLMAASPLSRDAARVVIAARLAALAKAPDFLDGQAVAALIDHAAGSPQRLRAALASTLFLASTEDAPHVGRALVLRALQDSDARPSMPAAITPRRHMAWPLAGATAAGLAVALAAVLLPHRVPPHLLAASILTPAPSRSPAAPSIAAPRAPAKPIAALPSTAEPPAAVIKPPPSPPALAEQRVAPPVLPPDILPAAPQATAVLMYSTRDPAVLGRLDDLVRRLRQAGIGQIETRAVSPASAARRPVSYFFADDYDKAQTISAVLLDEGWPRLQRNSMAPRLVLPPTGVAPRHPGQIEVRLP